MFVCVIFYKLRFMCISLGSRMMYSNNQEALLRRKLEEQQQAADLQQAIEIQGRRFMGLQFLDLKNRNMASLSSPRNITTTHDEATQEGQSFVYFFCAVRSCTELITESPFRFVIQTSPQVLWVLLLLFLLPEQKSRALM